MGRIMKDFNWPGTLVGWLLGLGVAVGIDALAHPTGPVGFLIGIGSAIVGLVIGRRLIGRKRA
jgi:hypothetical protein